MPENKMNNNGFGAGFMADMLKDLQKQYEADKEPKGKGKRSNSPGKAGRKPGKADSLPAMPAAHTEQDAAMPADHSSQSPTVPDDHAAQSPTVPDDHAAQSPAVPDDHAAPVPAMPDAAAPGMHKTPATDTAELHPDDLPPGPYSIVSGPYKGGMGAVWRVHHTGWNVDLAMKRPQSKVFRTESDKQNFIEECKHWIDLGLHPNIVSCYYVREIDGIPTIFSEWMENGSLESHIKASTLYSGTKKEVQRRLLDIAIQFARGLHYAHENKLIHQDVKPDNLLLDKDWTAKVSDFGLARAWTLPASPGVEAAAPKYDSDSFVVTPSGGKSPAYCSPEQAASQLLTIKTDIYSWAVSILEMYLGRKPWAHNGQLTGPLAGIACRDYFEMCTERPIPKALQALLTRCLEQDPAQRPGDFSVIEAELVVIFKSVTGESYPRPKPQAAADTADSLNNHALSYLDLGMEKEAEACWKEALEKTPEHLSSLYNQALYLWRKGFIDDEEVLRRCSASRQSKGNEGLPSRWYEQICRERGVFEDVPFGESRLLHKWETKTPGRRNMAMTDSEGKRLYLSVPNQGWCVETSGWQTVYRIDTGDKIGIQLLEDGKTISYLSRNNKTLCLADASDGRVLGSHTFENEVSGVHLHPDGRHLFISVGQTLQKWDRKTWTLVKKWDARTDPQLRSSEPHLGGNQRFSEDGAFFYQADNKFFAEWDTKTLALKMKARLGAWEGRISRNAEKIYASEFVGGTLLILRPGDCLYSPGSMADIPLLAPQRLLDYNNGNNKRAFWLSSDETRLLAGDGQGRLKLIDLESRRILCTWFGQAKRLSSAMASPDLSFVAGCYEDGNMLVFRGQTESVLAPWELSRAADLASVQTKQERIEQLAGQITGRIKAGDRKQAVALLLEAEELEGDEGSALIRKLRRTLTARLKPQRFEAISEGDKILTGWHFPALGIAADPGSDGFCVGGFNSRQIKVFGSDHTPAETLEYPFDGWSGYFLEYSPSGRYLVAGLSTMVMIWDRKNDNKGRCITGIPEIPTEGSRIAVTPDEKKLLITGNDGFAVLTDLEDLTRRMYMREGKTCLGNGCFSPDGNKLYLSTWQHTGLLPGTGRLYPAVRIYDIEHYKHIRTVAMEDDRKIFRIALEPGGKRLYISFENDDRILTMDTETYAVTEGIRTGQRNSILMRFDPQGRIMATAPSRQEGSIKLWRLPDLAPLAALPPVNQQIGDLCFSADGCVMYATVGCNVRTWEIRWDLTV